MSEKKEKNGGITAAVWILSFVLWFTAAFFSSAEVFLNNQSDFPVGAKDILLPMLIFTLACGTVTGLILSVMCSIKKLKSAVEYIISLMLGILLAYYTQTLLLNSDMPVMLGEAVSFPINLKNTLNYLIYLAVMMAPPVILNSAKKKNKDTDTHLNCRAVIMISLGVFLMQGAGVAGSYAGNGIKNIDRTRYSAFSSAYPTMSLSKDKNVVVFLVDKLDGTYGDEMLESYPELYDSLAGFTFYRNNTTAYTGTFPSIPCMLTMTDYISGQYTNDEFLRMAWSGVTLPDILMRNGYTVNIIPAGVTLVDDFSLVEGKMSNAVQVEADYRVVYFGEKDSVVNTMLTYSMSRGLPYILKGIPFSDLCSSGLDRFVRVNEEKYDGNVWKTGSDADLQYYGYLKSHGVSADAEQPTFNFIYLFGPHSPNSELTALYDPTAETTDITSGRGSLMIIEDYLKMMKGAGVFDNSTIIILADHGIHSFGLKNEGEYHLNVPNTASLFIKPAGAPQERLMIDSQAALSNSYFGASILDYAGIDHSEYGYSYNDIISQGICEERKCTAIFYSVSWDKRIHVMYTIDGDARDMSSWHATDTVDVTDTFK